MKILRLKYMVAAVIIAFTMIGCTQESDANNRENISIEIYLVNGLTTSEVDELGIDDIPLAEEPLLTDKDIISYDWKKHEVELVEAIEISVIPVSGIPFVLLVNGERVYVGGIWSPLSSMSHDAPTICQIGFNKPIKTFVIDPGYPGRIPNSEDKRADERLHKALKNLGKLK